MTMKLCWLMDTGASSVELHLQDTFLLCYHMTEEWKGTEMMKDQGSLTAYIHEGDNCCLQVPWIHIATTENATWVLEGANCPTTNLSSFSSFLHIHDLFIPGNAMEFLSDSAACSVCYVVHSK